MAHKPSTSIMQKISVKCSWYSCNCCCGMQFDTMSLALRSNLLICCRESFFKGPEWCCVIHIVQLTSVVDLDILRVSKFYRVLQTFIELNSQWRIGIEIDQTIGYTWTLKKIYLVKKVKFLANQNLLGLTDLCRFRLCFLTKVWSKV